MSINAYIMKNGLNGGEIAGIVIGSVAFLAIVIALSLLFVKRNGRVKTRTLNNWHASGLYTPNRPNSN